MNACRNASAGLVALFLMGVATQAQQQPAQPQFKAPPGYQITSTTKSTNYNFTGYNRVIPMPMERLDWKQPEAPKGTKLDTGTYKPTKKTGTLLTNPTLLFPGFAAPKRIKTIAAKGKDGGTIVFLEYPSSLPPNARQLVNEYFYASRDIPADEPKDEVLITDTYVVIWSFGNPASEVKSEHQKKTFAAVSTSANEWIATHPKEAEEMKRKSAEQQAAKAAKEKAVQQKQK